MATVGRVVGRVGDYYIVKRYAIFATGYLLYKYASIVGTHIRAVRVTPEGAWLSSLDAALRELDRLNRSK